MNNIPSNPHLADILARLRWQVRQERFVLIGLHPRERLLASGLLGGLASSFFQLIVEPDMVTLVLPENDWRSLRPAFPQARVQRPYRVISFVLDLPDGLVGFMAVVAQALADAGVSLLAICGFTKDHVLVREADLERALGALDRLVQPYRSLE